MTGRVSSSAHRLKGVKSPIALSFPHLLPTNLHHLSCFAISVVRLWADSLNRGISQVRQNLPFVVLTCGLKFLTRLVQGEAVPLSSCVDDQRWLYTPGSGG